MIERTQHCDECHGRGEDKGVIIIKNLWIIMCFAFGIIQHSEYNHNIKDIYVTHPD